MLAVQESMMLQLDCSDWIVSHAWIDNKKTGSSDGQSSPVENPNLPVITARAEIVDAPGSGGLRGTFGVTGRAVRSLGEFDPLGEILTLVPIPFHLPPAEMEVP
jgi:hypothetical protein